MKTSALLITVVVMLHCAALGALFFIQGCGTTSGTGTPPPAAMTTTPMPPTTKDAVNYPPPQAVEKAPIVKPAPKEAAKTAKATETTEYVVRSGDSIGGIAKQYGISRSEIVELNKLSDPNKLRVGQKLMLPGTVKIKAAPAKHAVKAKAKAPAVEAAAAAPSAPVDVTAPAASAASIAPVAAEAVPGAGKEYVVQSGDSLSKIAKKCGTKISALREANKLANDKLKIGQKLIIPDASAAAPSVPAAPAAAAAPVAAETPAVAPVPPAEAAPATTAPATTAPAAPSATPETAAPSVAPAPAKPVANSGITHIVQPNEDINSVAKLYAVTVDEVAELNQLGTNRTVKVGQRLKIP